MIHKGFTEQKVRKVMATALSANKASIRVMEKAGLRLEKRFLYEGEEAILYSVDRDEYMGVLGEKVGYAR